MTTLRDILPSVPSVTASLNRRDGQPAKKRGGRRALGMVPFLAYLPPGDLEYLRGRGNASAAMREAVALHRAKFERKTKTKP